MKLFFVGVLGLVVSMMIFFTPLADAIMDPHASVKCCVRGKCSVVPKAQCDSMRGYIVGDCKQCR